MAIGAALMLVIVAQLVLYAQDWSTSSGWTRRNSAIESMKRGPASDRPLALAEEPSGRQDTSAKKEACYDP